MNLLTDRTNESNVDAAGVRKSERMIDDADEHDVEDEDEINESRALLGSNSASTYVSRPAAGGNLSAAAALVRGAMSTRSHMATQIDMTRLLFPFIVLSGCVFLLAFASRFDSWYITLLRALGLDTKADEISGSSGVELLFRVLQLTVAPVLAASIVTVAALSSRLYIPLGQLLASPLSWCGRGAGATGRNSVAVNATADFNTQNSINDEVRPQVWRRLRVFLLPLSWLLRNPLFMLLSSGKLMYT